MIKKLNLTGRDCGLLTVLFLIEFSRGAFFLTFLPFYGTKYMAVSVVSVGLVISVHYLFETIFKSAAGLYYDRYGRRIVLIGLLISLAGLLALSFFLNPLLQIAAAAVFGLGVSPLWLAVIKIVAPVELANRGGRMGAIFAFWLSGMGAGPVAINFAMAHSYHLALVVIISTFTLAVLVALVSFPRTAANSTQVRAYRLWDEVRRLACLSTVTRILLPGMFLQTMAASLLLPVLPLYAGDVLGLNHNQYALLLISAGAGTLLFLIPMGKLVDILSLKILLTAGFGLSTFFLVTLTFFHNLQAVFILAVLVGISYAVVLPAWNALLAKVISVEQQATGWGIFGTVEGLGIAVGPALGGLVTKFLGPIGSVYLSASILGMMASFYAFVNFTFEKAVD